MSFFPLIAASLSWTFAYAERPCVAKSLVPIVITGVRCKPWLFGFQDDETGLRIAEDGERLRGSFHYDNGKLEGLSLHDCALTNNDIRRISQLRSLKRLYVHSLDLSGLDLGPLTVLGSLEQLTIKDAKIRESQLDFVRKLTRLFHIEISDCALSGDFLLKIPNPKGVKSLDLSNIRGLRGSNLNRFFEKATAIQLLYLASDNLAAADLSGIQNLTECGLLWLKDNKALQGDICQYCVRMRGLEYLTLAGTQVSDAAVDDLCRLRSLVHLNLENTPIGDGLRRVEGLDRLEKLSLANTRVGDTGMEGVVRSRNIKDLDISGTLVTDRGLVRLSGLKSLEVLGVSKTNVTDRSLHALQELRNLGHLDLSGTMVGDGVAQLGTLELLTSLKLAGTKVGNPAVRGLSGCARLMRLDLSGSLVDDVGIGPLAKLGYLEELNLAGTAVGDKGAQFLSKCPSLDTLNLAHTRIGDDGLTHLSRIAQLNLSGTRVSPRGILQLLNQEGTHLMFIDVRDTQFKAVDLDKIVRPGGRRVLISPFCSDLVSPFGDKPPVF